MKFTPVIALTLCVVFSTQVLSQDDLPECPQFDWLTISSTIDELLYTQLEKGGPADGKCSLNDKWIIHGDPYDLPSVCTCIEIPTKPEIKPDEGERCADWKLVHPDDTAMQSWKRNYDLYKSITPSNGWCPEGQIKWVVFGELIGVEDDTCFCIKDYEFNSFDVHRRTVPKFAPGVIARARETYDW